MSLTCRASGLDLACRFSVCLGSGRWAKVSVARCRGPRRRFASVFLGVRFGSAWRGFADLENRQRRKPFVGSNPTPSVFWNGFFQQQRGYSAVGKAALFPRVWKGPGIADLSAVSAHGDSFGCFQMRSSRWCRSPQRASRGLSRSQRPGRAMLDLPESRDGGGCR